MCQGMGPEHDGKNEIQNAITMYFNLLYSKNHHEILRANVQDHC